MRNLASIARGLWMFLGNDSRVRVLLGTIAVASYFGSALLGLTMVVLGVFDSEDAKELYGTWTLVLGPIVGAVIGYYFGGTPRRSKGPGGKGLLALIIAILFFVPTSIVACLGVFGHLEIALVREYIELWVLFSGPFTGVVFGFYFSTEREANADSEGH